MTPLSDSQGYFEDGNYYLMSEDVKQALKAFKKDVCPEADFTTNALMTLPIGADRIPQEDIVNKLFKHFGSLADE